MMRQASGRRKTRIVIFTMMILFGWAGAPSLTHAAGYWTCSDGDWVAIGHPDHARPSKSCGSRLVIPSTRPACDSAGGTWGKFGLFPREICRVPTHDAGRKCADADECEGTCLAAPTRAQLDRLRKHEKLRMDGQCTPHVPMFGCMAVVEKGLVSRLVCRD
jgi:hypothetical protein